CDISSDKLELDVVHFYHARAETFDQNKQFRESFDLVTARAVARMSVLSELCLPLVKQNGLFIAMKGSQGDDELVAGMKSVKALGGKHVKTESFILPKEESDRKMIFIEKVKRKAKKYKRKPCTPNRHQ